MSFSVQAGFHPNDQARVANLFWYAFRGKLSRLLGPDEKAARFLDRVLNPAFALSAYDPKGTLLGVAGFKTQDGALVGGTFADLSACFGTFGAVWRGTFLDMLERPLRDNELCMDGIFVTEDARRQGVGTALLAAIQDQARALGKSTVRLDVIDTNPQARALYERVGFEPRDTFTTGLLWPIFGFRSATRMVLSLS